MSDINVVSKTQKLLVDAPSKTVSVVLAGPQGPLGLPGPTGPAGPPCLTIPWHADAGASYTLTNSPLAERIMGNLPERAIKLVPAIDSYSQIRLTGYVVLGSASASTPRVRVLGKTGAHSTAVGTFVAAGVTEVAISLATIGFKDSGWVNLAETLIGDVFIAMTELGGDGLLDPSLGHLALHLQ